MFKKMREQKGFTLAELLVVVAIIGVLVAVSVPIFTSQLRKAKLATNQANARAAYAVTVATLLDEGAAEGTGEYSLGKGSVTISPNATAQSVTTPVNEWAVDTVVGENTMAGDKTAQKWTVTINRDGISYLGSEFK